MFNMFKKQPTGETVTFKISGMHCTSCAMNIDGELEDTKGVLSATTHFARSQTTVTYDPTKITTEDIVSVIKKVGYTAVTLLQ